jgi:hypothetical protein
MFLGLQRRHMRGTIFGNLGLTNSIRPLLRHTLSSPILVPDYAQQLSPQINVELGGGPEVFGWDRCAGHLCSMLMLSSIYSLGDALRKTLGKNLRNAMERRL